MRTARQSPEITGWRKLTPEDCAAPVKREGIQKIRDAHHLLAKFFAMGYGTSDAAELAGYSISRASILRNDPAFSQLVEEYREMVTAKQMDSVDEYYGVISRIRAKTARMIDEKLDSVEDIENISFRELAMIHSDIADRTGYPKRSVAVNVNVDFAARLDQAISRSNAAKVVNPAGASPPLLPTGSGEGADDRRPLPTVIDNEEKV